VPDDGKGRRLLKGLTIRAYRIIHPRTRAPAEEFVHQKVSAEGAVILAHPNGDFTPKVTGLCNITGIRSTKKGRIWPDTTPNA
jgi:hypothetical protein